MKVLNVNFTLDLIAGGGSAERTFQMSKFLSRAGVECSIFTLNPGMTLEQERELAEVRVIAPPYLIHRYHIPRFSFGQVLKLVAGVDIVHVMSHWAPINALVCLAAWRLGKPYVVSPVGSFPIYGRSRRLKKLYDRLIGRRIIRKADGHIAVTAEEASQFEAYGIKVSRVSIIPNGIDPDGYRDQDDAGFRRKHGLGEDPFILFVGRLSHIKGPDVLLSAFYQAGQALRNYRLVFAGPDEGMLSGLRNFAREYGVQDRVHFVGYLGGAEKSYAYHACELLVIPSRQEAMSIVVLEAGITGTPVLLTDRCGFDEVASMGGGAMVSASEDGLRKGLEEMLSDPARLKMMGSKLREFVEARYAWNSVVEEFLELFNAILQETR